MIQTTFMYEHSQIFYVTYTKSDKIEKPLCCVLRSGWIKNQQEDRESHNRWSYGERRSQYKITTSRTDRKRFIEFNTFIERSDALRMMADRIVSEKIVLLSFLPDLQWYKCERYHCCHHWGFGLGQLGATPQGGQGCQFVRSTIPAALNKLFNITNHGKS